MAFIVKKTISGREYFYLNENKRVDGKVKTKTLAYLGKSKKEAKKRAERALQEKPTGVRGSKDIGDQRENQECPRKRLE